VAESGPRFPEKTHISCGMTIQPAVPVRGKILVLDDNPIIQRAVYFALRDHGYKVLMCGEVTDALKMIRAERLDLIMVDLSFPADAGNIGGPVHDGFFLIDCVRRMPGNEKIPIMIISGSEPATYKERATAVGVNVCFHKPLNKEALLAAVQQALDKNKSDGQTEQI
jgi:CheY-like chemotaxis protein